MLNDITLDNLLSTWSNVHYGQLSVLMAHLRYLNILHHTHHWVAGSYSDHLLFEQLYESVRTEIDLLAERAIGLSDIETVDITRQLRTLQAIVKEDDVESMISDQNNRLIFKSLEAENRFLEIIDFIKEDLQTNGLMTNGLEDLLGTIASQHEQHVYLLQNRAK